MQFTFSTASRVVFGQGRADSVGIEAAKLGTRAALVCGRNPDRVRFLIDDADKAGLDPVVITISGEPDSEAVSAAAERAREKGCDMVIAAGGGSVLDGGKALAALLTNTRDVLDYLEVVGRGLPLKKRPAPLIAVPTTSGTGAEVTANAVLSVREHGLKVSMRSRDLIPDIAVVDPLLTVSMPPEVTAASGMDALTQLMESFVSHAANPLTDALCREGMLRAARSLRTAYEDGSDIAAREDMSTAALFSGMALANAKLGAAHGFAAPLGGRFHAPHGALCAALLPHVMDVNIRILNERNPENPARAAYREVARILTGNPDARAADGVQHVRDLLKALNIPGLADMNVTQADLPEIAEQAAESSSMKGNPVQFTLSESIEVLRSAM